MRAISTLSFEEGTSTLAAWRAPRCGCARSCRRRDRSCSCGSTSGLPARLDHAGDVPGEGLLTEADPAELELPQVTPRTAARAAAVVLAHAELGRPLLLGNERRLRHLSTLLMPERHAEVLEEKLALLVRAGGRHEGDVHPAHLVHLRVVH